MNENESQDREGLDLLQLTSPIAFQRIFVDWTDSINAALMLSQIVYWTRVVGWGEWFYKTSGEWHKELGLTKRMQMLAREILRECGLIEEKRAGIPARLYFRLSRKEYQQRLNKREQQEVTKRNDSRDGSVTSISSKTTQETKDCGRKDPATMLPADAGESPFIITCANKLEDFVRSSRQLDGRRHNPKEWHKHLRLLLQDLQGDKQRMKAVLQCYITKPHDKYTPMILCARALRDKWPQIERWAGHVIPPKPEIRVARSKEEFDRMVGR